MHEMTYITRTVDAMARPRKPESEKYRTPVLSVRAPRLAEIQAAAEANGETVTDFALRALDNELRRQKRRHAQKESPIMRTDTGDAQ